MLDRVVQPVYDAKKRSRQTLQPYQSVWLAHWKPTSCDAAEETSNPEASGNDDSTKEVADSFRSVEEIEMTKTTTFEMGGEIVKISSKSKGNERMLSSLLKGGRDTNGMQALKTDFTHTLERGKAVACNNGDQFPSLLHSGKAAGSSVNACLRESIVCDRYLSTYCLDTLPKMQKTSGTRLFPSQCTSSEDSGTKKSHNDCYTLLKLQKCVHDVDTVRIFTTNGLLIKNPTDVNAVIENDMFGGTRVASKLNGKKSSECHCESPFLGHGKQQVILQPLNSLIDSQGKEKRRDVRTCNVTIRSESSAEIANMEMDSFEKKTLHFGSNSTSSTKALNLETSIPPQSHVGSSREVRNGQLNSNPPDITLEHPALGSAASLSENTHRNSSKTQSLETNKLVEKSKLNLNDFPNADPADKWVKRLKLTSSNHSSQGTKSSHFTSTSSHQETSKILSSEPTLEKQHEDQRMENPKDEGVGLLLSHAWIQRWLHNRQGMTGRKHETNVSYEQKCSMGEIQKEHLPSIAAMALMAKVLTCFHPCELQKRGPFTIWNTKTF